MRSLQHQEIIEKYLVNTFLEEFFNQHGFVLSVINGQGNIFVKEFKTKNILADDFIVYQLKKYLIIPLCLKTLKVLTSNGRELFEIEELVPVRSLI